MPEATLGAKDCAKHGGSRATVDLAEPDRGSVCRLPPCESRRGDEHALAEGRREGCRRRALGDPACCPGVPSRTWAMRGRVWARALNGSTSEWSLEHEVLSWAEWGGVGEPPMPAAGNSGGGGEARGLLFLPRLLEKERRGDLVSFSPFFFFLSKPDAPVGRRRLKGGSGNTPMYCGAPQAA